MSGTVVEVTTPVFGGAPLVETWIVAEADPAEALLIVNKVSGAASNVKVEAIAKVTAEVIAALKIPPGKAGLWTLK